jgi:hypothetical protein
VERADGEHRDRDVAADALDFTSPYLGLANRLSLPDVGTPGTP